MMDELYGLHSTVDISTQQQQQEAGAENMVSWVNYWNNNDILAPAVGGFGDGNHVYGSEQMGSGSSGISDAVSSMVAEIHKNGSEEEVSSAIRAKIASHPLYPKLLEAYIDCQKVGAPRELANLLDEIRREGDVSKRNNVVSSRWGSDPELDEFMGTYCNILEKYKLDLSKPFDEASSFLNDMKTQLTSLCSGASRSHGSGKDVHYFVVV